MNWTQVISAYKGHLYKIHTSLYSYINNVTIHYWFKL